MDSPQTTAAQDLSAAQSTGKIKQRELTQEMINELILKTPKNWAASPPKTKKEKKEKALKPDI
ncbi:hypothetical protein [Robbsia sp. KACC 23696]|uniref:hypothetical protein n=1 Tax=Robbsia sp. KACC 23696 TaxID=3149231 RepID=UPI00325BE408